MRNDYSYNLIVKRGAKTVKFGDGKVYNTIRGNVIFDTTEGVGSCHLEISGIGNATYQSLCFQNVTVPITYIELILGFKSNISKVFSGVVNTSTERRSDNNTSLIIDSNTLSTRFNTISISIKKGSTYKILKQQFANALELNLDSDIEEDNKTIEKDYYYCNSDCISELKSLFHKQDVYVENKTLHFKPSIDSDIAMVKSNGYDISNYIVGLISPISQYMIQVKCFLLPSVKPQDKVKISINGQFDKNKRYNGVYLVASINHEFSIAKISERQGSNTTTLILYSKNIVERI